MKKKTFVEGVSLLFVTLFLYTGISKLLDYDIVSQQIALAPALAPVAGAAAIVVPMVEIVTAIILFLPRTRRTGLWVSLALMGLFTVYIVYILSYDRRLPCSCGGVLEILSWPQHLLLNTALMGLLGLSLRLSRPSAGSLNIQDRNTTFFDKPTSVQP